jgi:putative ABC transport system ATP-binding protein
MNRDPVVELQSVSKSYGGDGARVTALRDVSLQIDAGELVAVVGRSGSGKSTLLHLLGGLDRQSQGRVRIASTDLGSLSEDQLARFRGRSVGVVFQFFQLLPSLTILENVLLAMDLTGVIAPRERRTRAERLLGQVELGQLGHRLPAQLSGGQQQRAAVARALANAPGLLLADEPTGNLDSASAASVLTLLGELAAHGTTVVVVTHDEAVSRRAHRVVRMVDGAVSDDRRAQEQRPC